MKLPHYSLDDLTRLRRDYSLMVSPPYRRDLREAAQVIVRLCDDLSIAQNEARSAMGTLYIIRQTIDETLEDDE